MNAKLLITSMSALAIWLIPNLVLAAESSQPVITTNKPVMVDPTPASINKVPTTQVVKPNIDINQTKATVKLPDAVKLQAIKTPTNPRSGIILSLRSGMPGTSPTALAAPSKPRP